MEGAGRPAVRSIDPWVRRPPPVPSAVDPTVLQTVHEATRALLAAGSTREVVDVVLTLAAALGAEIAPACSAGPDAMPWDLTFGVDEPLLPIAEQASIARLHLETLLPGFVEDARRVIMDLRHRAQLHEDATRDALTGLMNRRTLDRLLVQPRPGGAVAMVDFDRFKQLNDTAGHAAGDAVLAAFGRLLRDHLRSGDWTARYGGDELVVVVHAKPRVLVTRLEEVREAWTLNRPHPITFSAGVAPIVTTAGSALRAADTALYEAKVAGRARTEVSG